MTNAKLKEMAKQIAKAIKEMEDSSNPRSLTGRAGALAALDRLYAENSEGLKRLADG